MKIFLLEPDRELADTIDQYLNTLRLKMDIKKVTTEEELHLEGAALESYALFILNLKNPIDPCAMKFIRSNGGDAPILLILEKDPHVSIFKTIYYLGYDDMIVKDFVAEEIAFRIYKLCDIWNDDSFFISQDVYFDFKNTKFVDHENEIILGKKEALLLKYLLMKPQHVVSSDEIACYVYEDEIISEDRIRSLVRQLRSKIPHDLIETVKGEGYKIAVPHIEKEIHDSPTSKIVELLLYGTTFTNYCSPYIC